MYDAAKSCAAVNKRADERKLTDAGSCKFILKQNAADFTAEEQETAQAEAPEQHTSKKGGVGCMGKLILPVERLRF